jgi:integrase
LTAQRPGEVCSMRFEHIRNEKDGYWWSLPGAPSTIWPGTKNKRDHEIYLTEPVVELLRELELKTSGYVFPSTTIPSTQSIWRSAGIPRFRPHDLRATAATKMDELGISRQHISLVLNHVEGGVTASYVRHDKRRHKRDALELWARELKAILEGTGKTDHKADVVPMVAKG